MINHASEWVTRSAYANNLGIVLQSLDEQTAILHLPFNKANANPIGQALHGGVAASLSVTAAETLARHVFGPDCGPWHTLGFQINYLAAALGEAVTATASLSRRGKDLCFITVAVASEEGKAIAQVNVAVRARHNQEAETVKKSLTDDGRIDPGFMKERLALNPFIVGRGIEPEYMSQGRVRFIMPWRDANGDHDGGVHEGAALALLDTAGAMCAWSITGPGKFKASTPSIQAQVLAPPPKTDLIAYGHTIMRDNEMFWNDVEVSDASNGNLLVRGTVLYRLFG